MTAALFGIAPVLAIVAFLAGVTVGARGKQQMRKELDRLQRLEKLRNISEGRSR